MRTRSEVTGRQIALIGTLYAMATTVTSVQAQAAAFARQHLLLSYLLVFVVLLLPLWLLFRLLGRFQGRDLYQLLIERHPVAGRIVTAAYMLHFFWIAARDVRLTSDFMKVSFLQRTPIALITALSIWVVIMMVRETGILVLARSTEIYAMLLLLSVPLIAILVARELEIEYVLPLQEIDMPGVLQGAWILGSYIGDIVGVAFLASGGTIRYRDSVMGLVLATGSLAVISTLAVLTLGIPVMSSMVYPIYELVRQIRVTDFLDRFELPILAIWIPAVTCKIGYNLYLVCLGFKRLVPGLPGKCLAIPIGMLLFACSFWFFENAVDLANMNLTTPVVHYTFQLLLPVLLFAVLWPKRRAAGGDAGNGGEG